MNIPGVKDMHIDYTPDEGLIDVAVDAIRE